MNTKFIKTTGNIIYNTNKEIKMWKSVLCVTNQRQTDSVRDSKFYNDLRIENEIPALSNQ